MFVGDITSIFIRINRHPLISALIIEK
jgi:hypothetical protein